MNTPTPRTDEGEWDITSYDARQPEMVVTSFLARALERELAALTEAQNLQSAIWESLKTAISERNQLIAEVERLTSDRDCEKRLRKDADEFRENVIERAEKAEAELAKERARLDWLETSDPDALHWWTVGRPNSIRADIDAAMSEDAK